jgi:hypothetical protein
MKRPRLSENDEGDFRSRMRIDREQLDLELAEQGELYNHVARKLAAAINERDRLEEDKKLAKAEAALRIRKRQENLKGDVREKAIEALIESDADYRAAVDDYLRSCKKADDLRADTEGMAQRGYALKDLAALWLGGYWQSNSAQSRDSREARGEQAVARREAAYAQRQEGRRRRVRV